ncbi:MAG: LptF/LptG family permease [Desulfobulbales bacterium]
MILLDRYLFKQFIKNLLLVMVALVIIYLLIDFFERMDDFVEHQKSLGLAAKYFMLKIPLIIEQLTPVIILLGGIIVLGLLNHNGEILAFKAVGIQTFRITVPITGAAVIFTLMILALAQWIVPATTANTNAILFVDVWHEKPRGILRKNRFYYKDNQGFYSFQSDKQGDNRFAHFIFTSWDANYHLDTLLTADSASWQNGIWTFFNSRIKQRKPDGSYAVTFAAKTNFPLAAEPKDFFIPPYKINEMSLSGLYVLSRENKGMRGTEAGLKLLERTSFILLGIPLLMLGLPLLLIAHQKWGRDLSLAVPLSCGLSFGAWGSWSVLQSLAKAEVINPLLAASAVHLLAAAIGTFLILQTDR